MEPAGSAVDEQARDEEAIARGLSLGALGMRVVARRARLQAEIARGHALSRAGLPQREEAHRIEAELPGGMLEALAIAGELNRDTGPLDAHYTRSMPAQLARQLVQARVPEERLFTARLSLARLPRLSRALEGLFSRVADAGLPCAPTLGATSPAALLRERPTLARLYSGCHFGRSMPMLYAYPNDLGALGEERSPAEWIDARFAGPIAHELAHLHPLDPDLVPAPGNLHEALAAWLGSEAFPEQLWPAPPQRVSEVAGAPGLHDADRALEQAAETRAIDPGGLDALPGGGYFASVGGWLARAVGAREAIRAQAGALDLDRALPGGTAALRLYGWLPHLESGAPHLLADTFAVERWWKLIDLPRDPRLARALEEELVRPLLEQPPPPLGGALVSRWNRWLDALPWQELPAWRDAVTDDDLSPARRASRALFVRTVRHQGSFRAERITPPEPLALDVRACMLRAAWPGPDAVGAPPQHPLPPPLCAAWDRALVATVRANATGELPSPPRPS